MAVNEKEHYKLPLPPQGFQIDSLDIQMTTPSDVNLLKYTFNSVRIQLVIFNFSVCQRNGNPNPETWKLTYPNNGTKFPEI